MWKYAVGFGFGSLVTYLLVGDIDVKKTFDNAVNRVKECIVPKNGAPAPAGETNG